MTRERLIRELRSLSQVLLDSDRRQVEVEERLKVSEKRYREIMEDSGACLWDDDWSAIKKELDNLVDQGVSNFREYFDNHPDELIKIYHLAKTNTVSKGLTILYGAPSMEALLDRWNNNVTEEELGGFLSAAISLMAGKTSFEYVAEERKFDGSPIVTYTQLTVLPDSIHSWSRVVMATIDITGRRQAEVALQDSEERFRDFAETASDWLWEMDENLRFTYISDRFARSGLNADRRLGKTRVEASDDDTSKPEWQEHLADLEARRPFRDFFHKVRTPDGRLIQVSVNGMPIFDEAGTFRGYRGTGTDITERREVEDRLRQAQKMEAVGQLTAGVAHDFNNMLAVIWGNAELLEDELGADNPQLAAVVRATRRGADLTQRLLAFSRKQVLNPEIVNANNLIADMIDMLRRTLEEHIDIETVTGADLWNCEVDPAQLENALVNLAINARDAMPDGGKLTIETANARLDDDYAAAQAEVRPGQYVMLAVTDNGSGMAPEVQRHVFEPFFTTKAVGTGSGLGLSMVYGFVKQSDGHVTVYSEPGEGTTVKLYLPRSSETTAVDRKPATDEVPVARGETVLVVEDDPEVRTLVVALLSGLGYQIMEAATGAAALEQLGSPTRVNLLLTDVVMPGGMNGRELAVEVARRAPDIKVLYMSGYTEDAILHHGRLDTDAKLLQKPFRRADLARAVRKVLDAPSA